MSKLTFALAVRAETIKRPRGESAEERKARKDAIKVDRLARRTEKSTTKETFGAEMKRQNKAAAKAVAGGRAADVKIGTGVRRLA